MFAPEQKTRSLPLVTTTRAHLGVLEAQPLDRVGELDVDAEVVAVELELVARAQPAVVLDVHDQPGDGAVDRELPVVVAGGVGLEADGRLGRRRGVFHALDRSRGSAECQEL